MKTKKNWINLTNGIEDIENLDNFSFIRIQSTTLERKDYIKLFLDLDHNFLIHLALGFDCVVYDRGTRKKYSKTISRGIPIIRYVLNRYWYGIQEKCFFVNRNGKELSNQTKYVEDIYNFLFLFNSNSEKEKVKTKLKYYKKFLNADEVYLKGESNSTNNDGNYPLYFNMLKKNYTV